MKLSAAIAGAAILLAGGGTHALTPPRGPSGEEVRLATGEVFRAAEGLELRPPHYPLEAALDAGEGWVLVNYVITTDT